MKPVSFPGCPLVLQFLHSRSETNRKDGLLTLNGTIIKSHVMVQQILHVWLEGYCSGRSTVGKHTTGHNTICENKAKGDWFLS